MDAAFLPVVIGVSVLALLAAVIALATSSGLYDRIGSDGPVPGADRAAAPVARDDEIRALLEARNARRAARGEPPVDVETQLRTLMAAAAPDRELAAEVRQLVEARNARRAARGEPPLDVESEVAKRLRNG